MKKHIHEVSRGKAVRAQDGGIDFDAVTFLTFIVAVLTAFDGLLTRKAEAEA